MATVKCKEKKSFQVFYYCGTPNCKATIEYVITKGNTNVFVSSTGDVASGFSQTITMPSLPDYYCLKIYAKCDGKICDSCVVCFKVDCIPDCCKGSKWGEKFVVDNNGVKKDLPACGSDTGTVKCNETKTLQVFYYCNPNCQTTAQVVYQFYTLSGTPVGSAVQVNSGDLANIITPSIQGSYCLRIYGKCAGTICDSCVICFKVECIPDCCKDGKWGEKFIVENNGAKKDLPPCGKDIATVLCKSTKTFQVYYYCNPKCNTTAEIEYQVYDGSNQPVGASVVVSSGALANITMPSIAGNYCIKISAKCGGKICAECKFCFKVECIDCCKDSKWGTISWKGFNTVKCGTTLTVVLPVNSVQTVNFTFNCYSGCTSSINYVVKTTSGTVISSVNSAASGVDKDITMPSGAGDYCLWAYGICNGIICDSCKVCFSTTCIDCKKVAIKDDTQQTTGNAFFNINGTIMTMFPISKITAQLVSFSADNDPSTSNNAPVPNFEFASTGSTIGGSVSLPFSLTSTRSNIAISGGPLPPNVPFNLFIDNYQDKKVKHYRVKFTIFFVNGTYCEKEIQKTF